jgi:hypothetical protein
MKDLKYYKDNCEEDYLHTPISVLRYITELEKRTETKPLIIDSVIVPKGTLLFHLKALTKQIEDSHCYGFEDILEDYIKSNAL